MSRSGNWRRIFLLGLCLLLLPLGTVAQAASSPFTDVPDSHWALAHIVKMELRGIITGYGNQIFKPENTVTQLEATAMAIRAMGLKDEAERLQADHLNRTYNLPTSWNAAGYVSLALDRGLIDADNFRHNQGATRAWVAQLIIRMIGAEQEAQAGSPNTIFIDDFAIGANYKKYVSLANEKEIITGIRNSSGAYEFRPNQLVKRSELAAMISRADRYMNHVPGQLPIATIQGINGQLIELAKQDGSTARHFTTSTTQIFDANAQKISASGLKEQDLVRYAVNQAGVFTFIEVLNKAHYQDVAGPTPVPQQQNLLDGQIVEHIPEASLMIIKDNRDVLHTLGYLPTTTVRDSLTNQTMAIIDLVEGDQVQVRLTNGVITEITLQSKTMSGITRGTIYSLNLDRGILTLEHNNRFSAYHLSGQVIVQHDGVRFPTINDLRVGDEVELIVENQIVEEIRLITPYQQATLEGSIVLISPSDRIVTIRTNTGDLQAYQLSMDVAITIEGITNPTLSDLKEGDQVRFTVSRNQISSLEVKNRSYQNELKGEVISIDRERMLLTIKDEQKELKVFEIDDHVFLDLGHRNPKLSDVTEGMIVNLKLDRNVVVEITTTNKVEGILEEVNENRNYITIHDGSRRQHFNLSDDYVDIWMLDVSRPRIKDLEAGQEVIIHLKDNEVYKIEVKEERHTTITRVRADYDRIVVRDGRSSTKEYRIYSDTKITIPGISRATIDDLQEGDIVTLKFVGTELKEVIVIPPYYGFITAIDGNRIVIQKGTETETIRMNHNLTVYNANENEMSPSGLRVHDFVRVTKMGDQYTLTQASTMEGELYTVSTSQGKIYFYDRNRAYRNLDLGRDVTAWSNAGTLLLGDLERGMEITMYLFDNKVVGIRVK